MPNVLTEKILKRKVKDIIKKEKDKDLVLKGIKMYREMEADEKVKEQSQRAMATKLVVDDNKLQEMIDWSPYHPKRHQKQIEVLNCQNDKIVIMAGKRGGKTALCAYFALKGLLEGQDVLVVAPSYGLGDRILEYLHNWIKKAFVDEMKVSFRPPQKVTTAWGATLDCRSAEQPDQIMGKEYPIVIADECSKVDEKIQQRFIVPATGTKIGKRYYISTPFGRNWFWKEWRRACEKGGGFQWKSIDNPYFRKEKWEQAKKELPDFIFKQEYEAEPQQDTMVFGGFPQCLENYPFPQSYNPKHLYLVGVDLGKYESFTAVSVIDRMLNKEVQHLRFQGDWGLQKQKIISLVDEYGQCPIWIDSTSITVGDAYVQELADAGYNVMGYKIQGGISKRQLVEKLIVMIQNRNIIFPDDAIGTSDSQEANLECRAYTYSLSPSGNIIYQAPQGEYDDCVMARALACWELDEKPLPEMKEAKNEAITFPEQKF